MVQTEVCVRWSPATGGPFSCALTGCYGCSLLCQGLSGLYAGLTPALLGSTLSWGLYFACYAVAKEYQHSRGRRKREGSSESQTGLAPGQHLLAAAQAGAVVTLVTNPIWVAKTRLQLQRRAGLGGASGGGALYTGLWDTLRRTAAEEGVRGLYAGLGPSLLLVGHGALQFAAYETLRSKLVEYRGRSGGSGSVSGAGGSAQGSSLSSAEFATLGAAAKLFASGCTYPVQVLRSRLQQRLSSLAPGTPRAVVPLIRRLLAQGGVMALYKGWVPNVVRVIPGSALTFVVYEKTHNALRQHAARARREEEGDHSS
jgi:solute carrier family 25 folate transporter 32